MSTTAGASASLSMSTSSVVSSIVVAIVAVLIGMVFWLLLSQEAVPEGALVDQLDPEYYIAPHLLGKANATAAETKVGLSVIIPAYNEEERLPIMMKETLDFLETTYGKPTGATSKKSYEIIVVDDGSEDSGALMVLKTYDRETVKVVKLRKNRGKGFAVRVGMLSATGERRLMVDADGATKFSDLAKLEKQLGAGVAAEGTKKTSEGVQENYVEGVQRRHEDQQHQIAFGSRHHLSQEATVKRAWYRNVLMWGLHFLVRLLITANGQPIHDTQCGFKLFTADAAEKLFRNLHIQRWAFDLELVVLAQQFGLSIAEVPVTWHEVPGSKLSIVSATLSMLKDMFKIRMCYLTGIWRIR
ncbi:unnamed protein product [Amoebophrya sp. A120]|nr:unnamed protein product [Amoebophrya sp. A120]|eukprot:GSA120T00018866001.1